MSLLRRNNKIINQLVILVEDRDSYFINKIKNNNSLTYQYLRLQLLNAK